MLQFGMSCNIKLVCVWVMVNMCKYKIAAKVRYKIIKRLKVKLFNCINTTHAYQAHDHT